MKLIASLTLALTLLILFSCKKDNVSRQVPPPDPTPAPVYPPDTLTIGWKKIKLTDSTTYFNDIFFIGNTGFCISSNNILKTTDAGVNWTVYNVFLANLSNLGMGSDTNAIFVGSRNSLIVTHDGGLTLIPLSLPDDYLTDVFFCKYYNCLCCWEKYMENYKWR